MTLTTYFWASLLIRGQSLWVTCVILVKVQPTGINGRAEKKIKSHMHVRMNVRCRFTCSFNTTARELSGTTNSRWLHVVGLCKFTVCQTAIKPGLYLFLIPRLGSPCAEQKYDCPVPCGLTAFTMMCTHPADLIWLQKLRVL